MQRPIVLPLLRRGKCPHCWSQFPSEDALWISADADLMGDPKLGPDQPRRFLPSRFTVEGNALDSRGQVCHSLACPKCHLLLPRAMVEMEPLFVSILGTPGCGKSFYLTAMTWDLRRTLAIHFGISFMEADTVLNRHLAEYEEALFLNPQSENLLPLGDLIRKTELQGDLYNTVMHGAQAVTYPRPLVFSMQAQEQHPNSPLANKLSRVCCLYDNAGEHFLAGQDSPRSPVTQHLAAASVLLFLFDPTQDMRFRQLCQSRKVSGTSMQNGRPTRQETVLMEAAQRIRRYSGLPQNVKHKRPLIVVVTKWDSWVGLMQDKNIQDPWVTTPNSKVARFDAARVERRSQEVRSILLQTTPEVVAAAESFCQQVIYVPVSALGRAPELDPRTQKLAIRTQQIRPLWASVPFIYGIYRSVPGLILPLSAAQQAVRPAARPSPQTSVQPATPRNFPRN